MTKKIKVKVIRKTKQEKFKVKVIRKTKQEKFIEKEVKERTFLEKLGFVQMVFDFYAAPVR